MLLFIVLFNTCLKYFSSLPVNTLKDIYYKDLPHVVHIKYVQFYIFSGCCILFDLLLHQKDSDFEDETPVQEEPPVQPKFELSTESLNGEVF